MAFFLRLPLIALAASHALLAQVDPPPPPTTIASSPCWIQDVASVAGKVWAMCDRNQIFFSSDQGQSWTKAAVATDVKLRSILFLDANRGFIAGDEGTVLLSEDGGRQWKKLTVPAQQHLTDIFFSGQSGWISGYSGTVLATKDGGNTWTKQSAGVAQALDSVFFADPTHGCAVGWGGTIVITSDGGATWKPIKTAGAQWSLTSVSFKDVNNGWAVGMFGQILRTRDAGTTWTVVPTTTRATLASITFEGSGRAWVTAESDLLWSDDGEKWVPAGRNELSFYHRLVRVGDSIWAVSPFGIMKRAADGKTWQKLETLKAS